MKILYLHQYFNTPAMKGGTRSYEMARRLVARGHDVYMITSRREGEHGGGNWEVENIEGIQVHWLPVPYSNAMSYPQRIAAFVRFAVGAARRAASIQGDLVFATSTPLTIALPGAYAAWRQGIPMVFEVRDLWPELPIAIGALKGRLAIAIARWLERFAYSRSRAVVALSPGMKDGVVRTGYPEERVTVIPNSCDLDLFRVPASEGQAFRQRYDWLQDRPMVLYCGTLGRINGVEYLAQVAAAARAFDPDLRFVVVGEGGEQEKVTRIATELGVLGDNFHMISSVPKQEVPAVLSAATLAVSLFVPLPEMWSNSANKFFDALASGTPVGINYRGWQEALLQESGAGLVLDEHDTEKAARQIVDALRDPAWLENAASAAARLAEEKFARDGLANDLEAVLIHALESRT
jgi:glycosyltransferase involved in cell wall biosynthesis